MPDSPIYLTCRERASCHCHDCVMQEREVKRQAVQDLVDDRDDLREQAARLEAELQQERDDAFTEAEHWQRQVTSLRAALEKYGRHLDTCGLAHYEGSLPCRCGLAEALNPPGAPAPAAAPPRAPGG